MDSSSKAAGATTTPVKEKTAAHSNRSKLNEIVKNTENYDPNVSSPGLKLSKTASSLKSDKSAKKSASRNPSHESVSSSSLRKKSRERKFVNLKKKSRNDELNSSTAAVASDKCKKPAGKSKCLSSAYESLLASQEDFCKNLHDVDNEVDADGKVKECEDGAEISRRKMEGDDVSMPGVNETDQRIRDKLLEEVPEPRSGKVMNLVKAFENLSVLKLENSVERRVEEAEDDKKGIKVSETQVSSSSFSPSELFLTSESLGLDPRRSFSLDSSHGSFSLSIGTSAVGQRSRRSSSESTGTFARRKWRRKQLRATSQKPFKLRTEQRGRCKEEEFTKKLQQMMEEEEKLRVPIAQGLPVTIDEPECLVKPPVKENTKPVDLVLHSDVRAVERSEFDHQVAKKMSVIEQYRAEKERRQKLEEEEEIRRLRKELVPKAQPMPYFDRPFIPIRRSTKNPTVRKEQKIRVP